MVLLKKALWPLMALFLGLTCVWFVVTQPTLSIEKSAPQVSVLPARLETHVRMLSETFVPRDWRHPENLDRAAAYITSELKRTNARVSEQAFVTDGRTYRNVIASFGPEGGERIIVGAHYDAHEGFPGADDNASGVAGLIELADLLNNQALPVRVDLIAFTLEETRRSDPDAPGVSLYGSTVHATSLKQDGASVRIMFSLEMIGFFTERRHSQSYPSPILELMYPDQGNFIVICGRLQEGAAVRQIKKAMQAATELPVRSFNAPSFVAGINRSDHAVYWVAGYPAVLITDTAFNRNPHYHTPEDVPESLDYNRMAMVVQGVYAAVMSFTHS
jgi:hypothetical protein